MTKKNKNKKTTGVAQTDIWGETSREDSQWSRSVLLFALAVSLRKARSHYSEHKANQPVPALLIRGPAISVWVVVLWCKDSKMSGSLVDQVNRALSLKQPSSALLHPADWLADWLTASQPAHEACRGRHSSAAALAESFRLLEGGGLNVDEVCVFFSAAVPQSNINIQLVCA